MPCWPSCSPSFWAKPPGPVTSNPDLEYKADDGVACPDEGKIAIVDFLWTEGHETTTLYEDQLITDDKVPLYNEAGSGRLQRMARAAGFETVLFKDADIKMNKGMTDKV